MKQRRSFTRRFTTGLVASVVGLAGVASVLSACGTDRELGEPSGGGTEPPALPASPVSLWLSADSVPQGPVELVGILLNHDGVDATFGVAAAVDRWDGGEWISHAQVVMCMDHWHCTARIEPAGGDGAVPAIGLAPSVGNPGPVERFTTDGLQVGWYRISQVANEGIAASAIFEVAGAAPEPAPLVSVEAPAISVTPALLPASGAPIDLYPLIPAPSGSQSREDIERAIAGLSEIALIERWHGTGWEPAGEVQLHEIQGDLLPRSAEVPPLAEGSYRLVRRGPGVDHVGHFWVDAAAEVVTAGG